MSNAWQITELDVDNALRKHNIHLSDTDLSKAFDLVSESADEIEKSILYYLEFEDQCDCCLSEIEDILIKNNIIPSESFKLFSVKKQ